MNGMPNTHVDAEYVRPGTDTLIERTERGTVKERFVIVDKQPCPTDPGNVHLIEKGGRTMCYLRAFKVEIL